MIEYRVAVQRWLQDTCLPVSLIFLYCAYLVYCAYIGREVITIVLASLVWRLLVVVHGFLCIRFLTVSVRLLYISCSIDSSLKRIGSICSRRARCLKYSFVLVFAEH